MDVANLADRLREAGKRHHGYEQTAPEHDWADWYAAFIDARERGRTPEEAYDDAGRYLEGTS